MVCAAACQFPNGTSPFDRFEAGEGIYVSGDALVLTGATPGVSPDVTVSTALDAAVRRGLDFVAVSDASSSMGLGGCRAADGWDVYCLEVPETWNAGPDFFDPATFGVPATAPVTLSASLVTLRPFGSAATVPGDSWLCLIPPDAQRQAAAEEFAFIDRPVAAARLTETTNQCWGLGGLSLYSQVTDTSRYTDSIAWDGVVLGDGLQGFGGADQAAVLAYLGQILDGDDTTIVAGSLSHNAMATEAVGTATLLGEWQTSLWVPRRDADAVFEAVRLGHTVAHHRAVQYRAHVYDRDGRWLGTVGDHIDTTRTDPMVRIVVEGTASPLHVLWIRPGRGSLQNAMVRPQATAEPVCDPQCRVDVAFEIDEDPPFALVGIVADTPFWNQQTPGSVEMSQEVAIANAIWFD